MHRQKPGGQRSPGVVKHWWWIEAVATAVRRCRKFTWTNLMMMRNRDGEMNGVEDSRAGNISAFLRSCGHSVGGPLSALADTLGLVKVMQVVYQN